MAYVGTVEFGKNDGPDVRRFLKAVGLAAGNPYCAAFGAFCMDASMPAPTIPSVRSGLASKYITRRSIGASKVLRGLCLAPGTIGIYKRGNTIFGHFFFVVWWCGECGLTVEANTSSGRYGSQSDGDGVWFRWRCIEPANVFRIVSFTPVVYPP